MTAKEFYDNIGGNYDEAIDRLMDDEILVELAQTFLEDKNYSTLMQAANDNNLEIAFRAAHTLKGLSSNLSYTTLTQISSTITEMLRAGELENAKQSLPKLTEIYNNTVENAKKLLA